MAKRQILLASDDYGESQFARGLCKVLEKDFDVTYFFGDGEGPGNDDVNIDPSESSAVVVTMSERPSLELTAAQEAVLLHKPLVLIATGSWRQEAFSGFIPSADALFVTSDFDAQKARREFPTAKIKVMGDPAIEDAHVPAVDRKNIRKKLGIPWGDKIVLVAGEKSVAVNTLMLFLTIEALETINESCSLAPRDLKVLFTVHPGHFASNYVRSMPTGSHLVPLREFYEEEIRGYGAKVDAHVSKLPTEELLPGADLVIGAGSTILKKAACQCIPAISFMLRAAYRGHGLPKNDLEWWWPTYCGAVDPLSEISADALGSKVKRHLKYPHLIRGLQEKYFPPRKRGEAFAVIMEEIFRIVKK